MPLKSLALLLLAVITGCSGPRQRFEFTRLCMGVQTRIILYAGAQEAASRAAAAAFDEIDRLDGILSDYRHSAEIHGLEQSAEGPPVKVSPELLEVLQEAQRIGRASGGAFDITVSPAVALWRESRRSGRLPSPEALAAARERIGIEHLELDPTQRTARLAKEGMRLDFGAIGKGYAAERAVNMLWDEGYPRAMVSLAGDIFAGAPPPGEAGWRIEVRPGQSVEPIGVLLISNAAISTSGDTEQFVEIEGRRYSHILDPRTGLGITARRSVTIVAHRGAWADALATAACILGPDASRDLFRPFPRTAAIFEERTEPGIERTIIDPIGLLHWSVAPAPTPR